MIPVVAIYSTFLQRAYDMILQDVAMLHLHVIFAPTLDDAGAVTTTTVQVPLITLVPVTASKIEKATVTAEFALEVINNELQISFPNNKSSENATVGKLEIVISPDRKSVV